MAMKKVTENTCKCVANCTHSYWIRIYDSGHIMASMYRSGGTEPDKFLPNEKEWNRQWNRYMME